MNNEGRIVFLSVFSKLSLKKQWNQIVISKNIGQMCNSKHLAVQPYLISILKPKLKLFKK